ncbi:MAG: class I SAM-dependent rRNA methyltransferase [Bacteroidaceae bacterium]|nr:class I SAM-dependent rRNA methyltransferase [Bacteroidaceae bacterium]
MKQVFLKYGKDESLRRYHPWIFSGAIHHFSDELEDGELVEVYASTPRPDHSGWNYEFIAVGHYQVGSIMVRVLSFEQEEIDQQFYEKRIRAAYEMRRTLGLGGSSFRLVHGEGDSLSGLVIDVYNQTAVMQAHSVGMHRQRTMIAAALKAVLGDAIQNIYYKSETTLAYAAEADGGNGFLLGGKADDVAEENGLKFHVDWLRGQKTGFFVDQRDNRALLERYSRDRRVLNMFCYTGGFSFYALRGGATLVHSVDSSQKAIDLTRANVELNFPSDPRHEAFCEDAFKFLDTIQPDAYDLIVLDPPAFAKHKDALRNALKGYTRLNYKAFQKLPAGGILFTFSCSQAVNKDQFRAAVFTAAAQAGRRVRILHQLHQPADHPINIYHPEGEYLKGLVLYVE